MFTTSLWFYWIGLEITLEAGKQADFKQKNPYTILIVNYGQCILLATNLFTKTS